MTEMHVIGQILGATNFKEDDLFSIWSFNSGNHWNQVSGKTKGQTQVDKRGEDNLNIWAHPIDCHFSSSSSSGWPKLVFQVWYKDKFNRNDFVGYGLINVPTQSGSFDLRCECWRPVSSGLDKLSEDIIGGRSQLKDVEAVFNGEDRRQLKTVSVGTVHVHLDVLLRNFSKYGVKTSQYMSSEIGASKAITTVNDSDE